MIKSNKEQLDVRNWFWMCHSGCQENSNPTQWCRRGQQLFLNGHCQPCDGVLIDSVSMGVWWIAWLATLAVVCLTDGKLNSRQMPPRVPLPPSYPPHKLTNISVFYAAALAPLLSLPAFFLSHLSRHQPPFNMHTFDLSLLSQGLAVHGFSKSLIKLL